MNDRVRFEITRQDARERPETRRRESFELAVTPEMTIADALFAIEREPVTLDGVRVAPVAFESACFSEACGRCMLLVNDQARSACRTRVELVSVRSRVRLAPLGKFPLVRDLIVDRSALEASLLKTRAFFLPPPDKDPTPAPSALDRCSGCGACLEACPEWHAGSPFVGAAALNEVHLLDVIAGADLGAVLGDGGVQDCGKARNCVAVCPEQIPLFDSILALSAQATRHWLKSWLRRGRP